MVTEQASVTLPPTPLVPSFELRNATYTNACQALASDVVYAMSYAEMDAWRDAKTVLACSCWHCSGKHLEPSRT